MTDAFFTDPRVTEHLSPEVLVFLQTNQPLQASPLEHQIGHWMGVTATVLTALADARQRIRELEADA